MNKFPSGAQSDFLNMNFLHTFLQIEASKLFSNVEDIYEVNLAFWTDHLSKVVENVSIFPL